MSPSPQPAPALDQARAEEILNTLPRTRILVLGDLILDRYIWGDVKRISPEAPVPIVHFARETTVPGGAANVARNLAQLGARVLPAGAVGCDDSGAALKHLLERDQIPVDAILELLDYPTPTKTRILASGQQLLRLDREERLRLSPSAEIKLRNDILRLLPEAKAFIIADYNKGILTQELLDFVKQECQARGVWLSLDPKPSHRLDLSGASLITPNRKEAFELAALADEGPSNDSPLEDTELRQVVEKLLQICAPAHILITLGEHGMLLCQPAKEPIHIPTVAREVFDVSGAGDTVIASITAAVAAGATLEEAAILANHAAGVVVAKVGTATATPAEILQTLSPQPTI
ncbi:MAG: bifunctional heptose 7-phosphate kinase/heptose 1-phosphate adenyltransferase [Limisphaerales bacterium]|jgi:rfaE bifunctional protein kinase chain/domain|nr:PfkB family carbohydrate kinase [Verrucomicrobiota bacterium]